MKPGRMHLKKGKADIRRAEISEKHSTSKLFFFFFTDSLIHGKHTVKILQEGMDQANQPLFDKYKLSASMSLGYMTTGILGL